jgi:Uma2 family endonuclease
MASLSQTRAGMTLEEFLRLPEESPSLEYIDGRIEAKVSPQKRHGAIESKLSAHLNQFAEPRGIGMAFPELRCTFRGRSIVPDVVFLLKEHIEVDEQGYFVDETRLPPDIHVEIISPEQTVRTSHEKLVHSSSHGCSLGWLIHPYRETVDVYRPGQPIEKRASGDVLEGDPILPGYVLPVAELFGWLKPNF